MAVSPAGPQNRGRDGWPPTTGIDLGRVDGAVRIEVLYFDGCPHHEALLPRLRELLDRARVDGEIHLRRVESLEAAERERFLGSPTLRVDGRDVDPGAAERQDFGLKCRLYPGEQQTVGLPPDDWVLAALRRATGQDAA